MCKIVNNLFRGVCLCCKCFCSFEFLICFGENVFLIVFYVNLCILEKIKLCEKY